MKNKLLQHDKLLLTTPGGIIGTDEVGRGALAGPVVAAAAWLSKEFYTKANRIKGVNLINDSKLLTPQKRQTIFDLLHNWQKKGLIQFHSAESSVQEIESLNILGASRLAMQRSLDKLIPTLPQEFQPPKSSGLPLWDRFITQNLTTKALLLVDGPPLTPFQYQHQAIIQGDSLSLAIATASIIAKITRDHLMTQLHQTYPLYNFHEHKGYATDSHRQTILKLGPTTLHRTLFLRNLNSTPPTQNDFH